MTCKISLICSLAIISLLISACSSNIRFANGNVQPKSNTSIKNTKSTTSTTNKSDVMSNNAVFKGMSSYYADKFDGKVTASGEIFNQALYTAAHKTLPFGTMLKVTRISNGKSVVVRVNDRGPFVEGRIIDLSLAAAKEIGLVIDGVAEVTIEVLDK
jgi:rare lipoprotein A